MKRVLSIILILILAAAFSSCSGKLSDSDSLSAGVEAEGSYEFISGETSSPNAYNSYISAVQGFSLEMLREFSSGDENVLFSPVLLHSQLALIENAAAGDTRGAVKKQIGKNLSLSELNECNGYFFSRIAALSSDKSYVKLTGNLFLNDGTVVSQDFLEKNAGYFRQNVFRMKLSESAEKISAYIDEQSGGVFKKVSLDAGDGVLALSTALLRDKWLDGYTKKNLKAEIFRGTKGEQDATLMKSTEYYLRGKRCEGFVKDFKNTPCKLIALLPEDDADDLLGGLNYGEYQNILDSFSVFKTCEAYLPQFEVKAQTALPEGGFEDLFKEGDFGGLSFGTKTELDSLTQFTELRVTEGGFGEKTSDGSASTKPKAKTTVRLDRPFVYMIVDNESYIPIFAGIVNHI